MKLPLRRTEPRAEVPLVMQVHSSSSRAAQSARRWPPHSGAGGVRKRAIMLGTAGAVCALGIALALGVPSGPTVTPLPIESPTMELAMPEVESSPPDDPRAFVIAEAFAGHLGESVLGLSDLRASVTSRNGDVVLVEIRGTSESGERRVSALVVRTADGWVLRETYDAGL